MKIENIRSYLLTNAAHLQLATAILSLILKFGQNQLKIATQYDIFRACVEKEDIAYKVIRKSDLSVMKEESDHARDTIILGIKDAIKSALRHFDANVREAAYRIKIVFDTYDNPQPIIQLPYDSETATVNNLLQELEGKYAADVQTVGLTAWVTELRNRNKAFETLTEAYTEQQSGKPAFSPKEARKETDKAYRDIVTVISAWILTEGEAAYAPFVTELNTVIKHYNDLIAQHLGRIEAKKEKENKEEESNKYVNNE